MAKSTKYLFYPLASALLLSLPWMGAGALPLLAAFIPLLRLQERLRGEAGRKGKPRRMWPYAALAFALWWAVSTWWVSVVFWPGGILSVLIGTLLCTSAFMIYHAVWKRGPRPLAYTLFVVAWISYEFLYIRGEVSFPWLTLGNGFAWSVKLAQWFEYTGILGGSLWVLVCNLLLFNAAKRWRNPRAWIVPGAAVILPALFSLTAYYRYAEPAQKAVVTVVQPNFDPFEEKFTLSQEEQTGVILGLMNEAPADVDFIVAPETALGETPWEGEEQYAYSVQEISALLRERYPQASVVIGASTRRLYPNRREASATARSRMTQEGVPVWYDFYNSALSIDAATRVDVHHKSILVAGAEKIPYYSLFKHLEFLIVDLGGISGQLGYDTVRRVFVSPRGVSNAAAICYESIYGGYFGEFARNGAQLMFVITNDGWWGNTAGHRHHFAYSRLRAIENRRSIGRSANTGISGFIDQRGDVGPTLGWDKRGVLTAELALNDKVTFYARYGDIIGRVSWLTFALCLLYFMAWRVRRKNHLVDEK